MKRTCTNCKTEKGVVSGEGPRTGKYDRDEVFIPVEALPGLIDWLQRAALNLGCPTVVG